MRVLLSCLQSPIRHPIPAYDFWRALFIEGCKEANVQCLEVPGIDWVEGLVKAPGSELDRWRTQTWERVLDYARREHDKQRIDLFLGYLYPKQVEPAAIIDLERLGIPSVNFFCDNVREFSRVPDEFLPFALHWVPEYEALPLYRRARLPHLHAPMPCWVAPAYRTVPASESEPATFIGTADLLRRQLLGAASQAGGDFVVRGYGWDSPEPGMQEVLQRTSTDILARQWRSVRQHGVASLVHKLEHRLRPVQVLPLPAERVRPTVTPDEYIRISREAIVTIGINRVPTSRASNHRPIRYSRLRDLEAPMLGACYLTEWTEGLESLYEVGSEVETYRSAEELASKLSHLRSNSEARRTLRQRGQHRALSEHTVAQSLRRIATRLLGRSPI